MPVESMSSRPLMGMVQALEMPGKLQRRVHLGLELLLGDAVPPEGAQHAPSATPAPSDEYQRGFSRHSASGLSTMVVSIIEKGAGSVEVLARPALPKTRSTSGKVRRILSWTCSAVLRLGDRHARLHRRRHVEDGPLVERRHELGAELQVDRDGGDDEEHAHGDGGLGVAQHEPAGPLVDPVQQPADGVLLLRVVLAHQRLRGEPGQRPAAGSGRARCARRACAWPGRG